MGYTCENPAGTKEMKDEMLKKLLAMPNVLITPHQAFATVQALTNIADTTFYNIDCAQSETPCKNLLTHSLVEEGISGNGVVSAKNDANHTKD